MRSESLWMYCNGRGVDQDYVEARRWYTLGAKQGNSSAQSNLGGMHYNGQGGPVDYAAAVTWWKRAADQGDADAITNLPRALSLLFPPGTRIELVDRPVLKQQLVKHPGSTGCEVLWMQHLTVRSSALVGKIAAVLEEGRGTKAVLFENLVVVPRTEANIRAERKKRT
jgi:hypothetical protein